MGKIEMLDIKVFIHKQESGEIHIDLYFPKDYDRMSKEFGYWWVKEEKQWASKIGLVLVSGTKKNFKIIERKIKGD